MSPSRRSAARASASTLGMVSRNQPFEEDHSVVEQAKPTEVRPHLLERHRQLGMGVERGTGVGGELARWAAGARRTNQRTITRRSLTPRDARTARARIEAPTAPHARLPYVARDPLVEGTLDERAEVMEPPAPHHGESVDGQSNPSSRYTSSNSNMGNGEPGRGGSAALNPVRPSSSSSRYRAHSFAGLRVRGGGRRLIR